MPDNQGNGTSCTKAVGIELIRAWADYGLDTVQRSIVLYGGCVERIESLELARATVTLNQFLDCACSAPQCQPS